MAREIVVTIPHALTRQDAIGRVRGGIDQLLKLVGGRVKVEQSEWFNDSVHLSMRVVGQSFAVTIAVDDKFVTITGKIPLMLSAFANPARQFVERHGALLLQKPGGR